MASFINQRMKVTKFECSLNGEEMIEYVPGMLTKDQIFDYVNSKADITLDRVHNIQYCECVFQMDKQDYINNAKIITERNLNDD